MEAIGVFRFLLSHDVVYPHIHSILLLCNLDFERNLETLVLWLDVHGFLRFSLHQCVGNDKQAAENLIL